MILSGPFAHSGQILSAERSCCAFPAPSRNQARQCGTSHAAAERPNCTLHTAAALQLTGGARNEPNGGSYDSIVTKATFSRDDRDESSSVKRPRSTVHPLLAMLI